MRKLNWNRLGKEALYGLAMGLAVGMAILIYTVVT